MWQKKIIIIKKCHFGIRIILNERHLKKIRCKKSALISPFFSLKVDENIPM